MECSSTSPLLHVKGSMYVVSQFSVLMKVRHPGRNPGTASLCALLLCSIYLFFHVGIPGRNPGTAWYLLFMLCVCRECSEIDSQSQSNVCHVKSSCDSTDERRNGSQEQREGRWETRKWSRGLGAGTYPACLFFNNFVVVYVGNSVSRNSGCSK